jgi:peptide deformylase
VVDGTERKMIYPIVAYGDPVLRKKATPVTRDYPKLDDIISNMFATMYHSSGVGLAAPQIGIPIRLFVIDATPFKEDDKDAAGFKRVFINAEMIEESGDPWKFNEGCLSIPGIREDILRKDRVRLRYLDENFVEHEEEFSGLPARVIQHEYDHIEGVLFTDRLTPLKKKLLKGKLTDISKGIVDADYKMRFYKK